MTSDAIAERATTIATLLLEHHVVSSAIVNGKNLMNDAPVSGTEFRMIIFNTDRASSNMLCKQRPLAQVLFAFVVHTPRNGTNEQTGGVALIKQCTNQRGRGVVPEKDITRNPQGTRCRRIEIKTERKPVRCVSTYLA